MITEFVVTAGEKAKRLDQFLVGREPDTSRTRLKRLVELGRIRLNEKQVKASQIIHPGDRITMDIPKASPLQLQGESLPLEIIFEDEELLVVNKPAGIVVHPASGNWTGTLVNALLHHFENSSGRLSSVGEKQRPGIVHRLDKQTSGLMVIAKTDQAHRALALQFERHIIRREYEAYVWKVPRVSQGTIHLGIGRDMKNRKVFSPKTTKPRDSKTQYRVERVYGNVASHVLLTPQTGRTHQLRVHLKALGHPILGDHTYGGRKVACVEDIQIPRVMLHARLLGFQHPLSRKIQTFTVSASADMEVIAQQLSRLSAHGDVVRSPTCSHIPSNV